MLTVGELFDGDDAAARGELSREGIPRDLKYVGLTDVNARELMRMARLNEGSSFGQTVQACLYQKPVEPSDSLREIVCLTNIRRILSFNYDDILETAFEVVGRKYDRLVAGDEIPFHSDTTLVFHPHGYLPRGANSSRRPLSIVLSEDDYHRLYSSPYSWANLVQITLLLTYCVLFIGCSFRDPNLRRLLDLVKEMRPQQRHYALLKTPPALKTDDRHSALAELPKVVQDTDMRERRIIPLWWSDESELVALLRQVAS